MTLISRIFSVPFLIAVPAALGLQSAFGDSPLPYKDRIQKMKTTCFERDWSKTQCSYKDPMNESTAYQIGKVDSVLWPTMTFFTESASDLKRLFDKYATPPGGCSMTSIMTNYQDVLLIEVEDSLKDFAAKKKLSQCQKACLATCASSQLITMNEDTAKEFEYQAAYILWKGDGVCRHYANLADDFMGALDISSSTVGGELYQDGEIGPHTWLSVKVDGKRLWMDPMHSDCEFIRTVQSEN